MTFEFDPSTDDIYAVGMTPPDIFHVCFASNAETIYDFRAANSVLLLIMKGTSLSLLGSLSLCILGLVLVISGIAYLIYRLDLGAGSIKKHGEAFETGWKP
ncbi:MAG: hypothetical protein JRN20_07575 [Nitrososphaerota archaeon]|nr:hypothetical protein [Nitrososphaerota archaeon]